MLFCRTVGWGPHHVISCKFKAQHFKMTVSSPRTTACLDLDMPLKTSKLQALGPLSRLEVLTLARSLQRYSLVWSWPGRYQQVVHFMYSDWWGGGVGSENLKTLALCEPFQHACRSPG